MHSISILISSFLLGGSVLVIEAANSTQSANEILMAHNNAHIQAGGEAVVPMTQEQKNLMTKQTQEQWKAKKDIGVKAQNQTSFQDTNELGENDEETDLIKVASNKNTTDTSLASKKPAKAGSDTESDLEEVEDEDDIDSNGQDEDEDSELSKLGKKEKEPVDPVTGNSSSKAGSVKSSEKSSPTEKSSGKNSTSSASSSASSSSRSRSNRSLSDSLDEDAESHANHLAVSSFTFLVAATFAAFQSL